MCRYLGGGATSDGMEDVLNDCHANIIHVSKSIRSFSFTLFTVKIKKKQNYLQKKQYWVKAVVSNGLIEDGIFPENTVRQK